MSVSRINLPKASREKAVVNALDKACSAIEQIRNPLSIEWYLTWWWLQGIRRFQNINYRNGRITIGFDGVDGKLRFKYEDVLQKSQVEMGRLAQLDLRPKVKPKPFGLQAVRDAMMGQVTYDNVLDPALLERRFEEARRMIVQFGPVGLAPHVDEWPDGTGIYDVEFINPWELGFMPAQPGSPEEAGAVVRDRWMPLEDIEARFGDIPESKRKDMRLRDVPYGESLQQPSSPLENQVAGSTPSEAQFQAQLANRAGPGLEDKSDSVSAWGRLVEVWEKGPEDTLARYIAKVGDVVLKDETFGDEDWFGRIQTQFEGMDLTDIKPPPFPVWVAGYFPVGGPYPRSFAAPLISTNKEVEELLSDVFKNIREFDQYGILALPAQMGVNERAMKQSSRPKIIRWEADPLSPTAEPKQFSPTNSGTLPGQVANLALQLLDRQAGQGALFGGDAPGRVDSQAGLDFLFRTQSVPLDVPAGSLSRAFVGVYKSLLYEAKFKLKDIDKLRLTTIDDSLAGIVVNGLDGTIGINAQNPIPWPHQVDVTVRNADPESREQRKAEIGQMFGAGLMTPVEFWITNYREDLGFLNVKPKVQAAIEKATLNNILLFGDGETHGEGIPFNFDADDVTVFLFVLEAFMAKTIFGLASEDVKDAFSLYKDDILESRGMRQPRNAPAPEQAAQLQAQAQAQPAF